MKKIIGANSFWTFGSKPSAPINESWFGSKPDRELDLPGSRVGSRVVVGSRVGSRVGST